MSQVQINSLWSITFLSGERDGYFQNEHTNVINICRLRAKSQAPLEGAN